MNEKSLISESSFGESSEGKVNLYTLTNDSDVVVKIINYGGIIQSIQTPDKAGESANIVLGFDKIEGYLQKHPYFGAIIGRYGNRIANGKFEIDGNVFELVTNNGPNHLHGGIKGFDKVLWKAQIMENDNGKYLRLTYESKDLEEGYPGNLSVSVEYQLVGNQLHIGYQAGTDKKTHVNLTNHSYFNLSGARDILSHELKLDASHFTPVDSTLIPTGEIRNVVGSAFDFRVNKKIGKDINSKEEQIIFGNGYDHNFVIDKPSLSEPFAMVSEPTSGRTIKVYTEEPGVQFYSGNFLDGSMKGFGGKAYEFRSGFCLETQHFPDSPNQKLFPSTLLSVGDTLVSRTVYEFGLIEDVEE